METLMICFAAMALACSIFATILALMIKSELLQVNTDVLECATKASILKLELDTLYSRTEPPVKKRRGRPRKNVEPKVIHTLGEL
tara:strand:- start:362 stop:616 length:255 start_codon:yes stop_codon:yes gene_type:complete